MLSVIRCMPTDSLSLSRSSGRSSPVTSRVKKSTPTARTSGSANGSLINALSAVVAIARAAATMVAVAPTLDARSHVSFSVRAIPRPLIDVVHGRYLGDVTTRRRLYAPILKAGSDAVACDGCGAGDPQLLVS